ncbi:O-antigen polymerase [Rivularia sp. IAM M-261]|nr:O-antigen polymerase [Calothrix sp. PCC 7716]GJD15470.1 O-antigen polymerase [Rivularia sp. IAM M-261]
MKVQLPEKILTVILLLITAGALAIQPAQEISSVPLGGAIVDTLLNAVSYAILFYLILRHWKGFFFVGSKGVLQLLLLGVILFSVLWSADVASSLTYLRGLIRIYLLAIYLAMRYTIREQMRFIAIALGTSAVLSIIFPLIPGFGGIHVAPELAGMWSGIFGHKNEMGYMMAWSAGVCMHLALSMNRYKWLLWLVFGISVCLISLSRSTTSLTILLAMTLLLPFYGSLKKTNYKLQVVMVASAIISLVTISVLIANNIDSLVGASGKDLTFNGRTDLWDFIFAKIFERPWFGYGFYGFWDSEIAASLRRQHPWASNAHNGFLEMILELGFVGFSLFIAGLIRFIMMALKRINSIAKKTEDYWCLQMLVIIIITNFSEARLLGPSWNWLMYITMSLSLTVSEYMTKKQAIIDREIQLIAQTNT